jgi:hypothetical protein
VTGFAEEKTMNRSLPGMALALLLTVAGCGAPARNGEVSGVVKFRGSPLPSGTVTFVMGDGEKFGAAIGTGGEYSLMGLPRGPARVTVASHPRVPEGFQGARPREPHVQIPDRYREAESSPLSFELKGGRQQYDIDLKP